MLGILLLIARGLPKRELFALRRPASWKRALGLAALALAAIYARGVRLRARALPLRQLDPSEEQGLVPDGWDSSRAGAFVAFFVVVTLVAPAVEELTYRGLGISLLAPRGPCSRSSRPESSSAPRTGSSSRCRSSTFFGIVVGWLRVRTNSVYPGMRLHANFNGDRADRVPSASS